MAWNGEMVNEKNSKIAVLVSGGVDSSVSLALLKEAGEDVEAFYLKIWLEDELAFLGECPWEEDLSYARAVCEKLGVPLHIIPLQKEYNERIISYTIAEVKAGRTPNPDMLCNPRIKFGAFFDALTRMEENFEKIATGHYAQTEMINGKTFLKRAKDTLKDQTYFLSQISQEQISRVLFPIGHLEKREVRMLAEKFGLSNAARKDSQGLCFLGNIKFEEFLKKYLGEKKGDLIEPETGEKKGEHHGFWFFTAGQREGIRLPDGPWFVAGKDTEKNIVFISKQKHGEGAARKTFTVARVNWIAGAPKGDKEKQKLTVKIRHGEKEFPCEIKINGSEEGKTVEVILENPTPGIAPGQFAVFYDGEYCLGGGVME